MKISYAVTTHNEFEELQTLIPILLKYKQSQDEIIVVDDNSDKELVEYLDKLFEVGSIQSWYTHELNKHFGEHKNYAIENATGDFIFHLDADEYPHQSLIEQIHSIIEMNDVELIWIPRVNTVKGITDEHCAKWGWRITDKGWINYPDYQARVFKRDDKIRWIKPVHEVITGATTYAHLPPVEELSLYHPKTIEKQEKQNKLYMEL